MKNSILILLAVTIFTFSSCKEKDSTTGTLQVTAIDGNNNALEYKNVFLYETEEDMTKHTQGEDVTYFKLGKTDKDGIEKFSFLAPKKYWICCDYDILGFSAYAKGSATIEIDKTTEVTIKP